MTTPSHTELAARNLWETIKILGLQNEKLALQAIAAALESPERVRGDWCRHCGSGNDSAGYAHLPGCFAVPTPSPQAEKQPLSEADEALMRQALDALEWVVDQAGGPACEHEGSVCFCKENNAITALRARLETSNV